MCENSSSVVKLMFNFRLSCFLAVLQTSELGVTEHIEGDPCKFALWAGRTPSSDNKTVLKVSLVLCPLIRHLFIAKISVWLLC